MICAFLTTAIVVRRELFSQPKTPVNSALQKAVYVEEWKSHLDKGITLGPRNADVQLIEFADFECPFCASFYASLKEARERYQIELAITFVHYPILGHRFAEPAARVAECAGAQGRFEAMHDLLYQWQEKFGLKPWTEFAVQAGVPDLAEFDACARRTGPVPRIIEGRELGNQLGVQGTPAVLINGWLLPRPPDPEELNNMIRAVLAGEPPIQSEAP